MNRPLIVVFHEKYSPLVLIRSMKTLQPDQSRIAWIGTGIMGAAMCDRLLDAGFNVDVYNRTESKAADLIRRGARWKPSVAEVAREADVVFLIVGFPNDVRQTVLGDVDPAGRPIPGLLESLRPGTLIVDMTTDSPSLAKELADAAAARQIGFLDAPVTGGDLGARNGTLSIMVGGDPACLEAIRPALEIMGQTIVHHGRAGCGQHAKMVNQILIAGNMVGVCEALLYARKAGLDMAKVFESVERGAAGSWSLTHLGGRILAGNFEPGFMIEHFIKDMGIALEESARFGIALPGLALVRQLYIAATAHGYAKNGTQALLRALAEINGMDWEETNVFP